ncbi:MAG: hypothetical protein A3D31_19295 [Candidatus Fluviicola riflensis]|nr:MAG: hypothetical protein CHH17_06020 [Candidatus Fluviicola riflensis]OGS75934.1 MAG: hypothetical protein A3D31_19295 [Candidatus Fluviicola riflensis]OGS83614.1 MAG: hypothetical protein A2724_19310 [Fluviicola sp. RIFCSPHIGHO2_01_FULL_43_53]OGS85753.1 MAG: hypothetical protein A3E30_18840 [Fluviicola sp. RIFCSPHIGHO2_12_FULL_43_24]
MRTFFLSLIVTAIAAGCHTAKEATTGNSVISIVHGTSFGHCRGYCIKEIHYSNASLVYKEISRDSVNFPVKETNEQFTQKELDELAAQLDWKKWEALDSVIGCPDCADRGSEYLIISTGKGTKKVIYDAHSTPEGLENILKTIREKRRVFARQEQNKGE